MRQQLSNLTRPLRRQTRKDTSGRLQSHGFVRAHSNPFMNEVCVKAMVLRDASNRSAGLGALLDNMGLEGFGIGTALWLHGKTLLKG